MNERQKQLVKFLEENLSPNATALDWLQFAGLAGLDRKTIVVGFGERLAKSGVKVSRLFLAHRTLHPQFDSFSTEWTDDGKVVDDLFPHRADSERSEDWLASPFYHILTNQILNYRVRLETENTPFPLLRRFKADGVTDYLAYARPFSSPFERPSTRGESEGDGMILSFVTRTPGGFSDYEVATINSLITPLSVAVRISTLIETGQTLLSTYLGSDAARRVLSGEIQRGAVRTINAVLWFSDMRGSTKLAEQLEPEAFVEMLNDYHQAGTEAVVAHGGEILKFIGDGLFAIFEIGKRDDPREVCLRAMLAAKQAGLNLRHVNDRRREMGQAVGKFDVGIHIGDMLYGNVGAENRLDFTVIGSSVNFAKRLEELCKITGDACLVSNDVYQLIADENILEPVGRFEVPGFAGEHLVYRVPLTVVT